MADGLTPNIKHEVILVAMDAVLEGRDKAFVDELLAANGVDPLSVCGVLVVDSVSGEVTIQLASK